MANYVLYAIIGVMAIIATKYSVSFILSVIEIPHEAVPIVSLILNVAVFIAVFFTLNFISGFVPVTAFYMPSPATTTPDIPPPEATSTSTPTSTPPPAATWTPTSTPPPAATWTPTQEPRSTPTQKPTSTRRPSVTPTKTPTLSPQVFGDIRRGEICNNQCYDYGSTVDFCFWSNFETNAKAMVYSYDTGQTFDLGNWNLDNEAQCLTGPMSAPYGRNRLEITGFDGSNGPISRSYEFCVSDC